MDARLGIDIRRKSVSETLIDVPSHTSRRHEPKYLLRVSLTSATFYIGAKIWIRDILGVSQHVKTTRTIYKHVVGHNI